MYSAELEAVGRNSVDIEDFLMKFEEREKLK